MAEDYQGLTPPPELVEEWASKSARTYRENGTYAQHELHLAAQAARWGADQQLDQDAKWLDTNALFSHNLTITPSGGALRQVMRPKPPSLKEQALEELEILSDYAHGLGCSESAIRRALEQLDD